MKECVQMIVKTALLTFLGLPTGTSSTAVWG